MKKSYDQFFEVVTEEVDKGNFTGIKNSDWACKHTKHPIQTHKPWSFKDHEFQIKIMNCESPFIASRKCSQIGVSEIFLRKGLIRSKRKLGHVLIYVFPTTSDVRKLVAHRVDSIIRETPSFKESLNPDLNNLEIKQIDNSFLYFTGSQKAGISVPANMVTVDEVDFCSQKNITTFQSRLGHNIEGEERFAGFSTPTISGYGVDAMMKGTSESHYMVKHYSCGKWNQIKFLEDIVIPNFDDPLKEFVKEDLDNPRINVDLAWVKCPSCNGTISPENMCDPTHRQWVHTHPDLYRDKAGFNCSPLDVFAYNPPARILKQIQGYELYSDWVNFKLGLPHSDASAILIAPKINSNPIVGGSNFLGVDVGKTTWFIVINVSNNGQIRIIHAESERLRWLGETTSTYNKAVELRKQFSIRGTVVDSLPDLSLSLSIASVFYNAFACEYTRNSMIVDGAKQIYNKKTDVVKVWRTGCFNELSKKLKLEYIMIAPGLSEEQTIKKHLGGLKKVTDTDSGEERWEKVSADHYSHALLYACVAADKIYCDKIIDTSDSTITANFSIAPVGNSLKLVNKAGRRIY